MLDPIKVTVVMPGVNDNGSLDAWGIPAAVVVKFLDTRGIVNEKSGDYIILFLFSMGNTKGKWGTLITELFEFKRHYDEGAPLEEIFPDLTNAYPDRYGGMTLKSLTDEMHKFKKDHKMCELLQQAYSVLPEPAVSYSEAYKNLVRGEVEHVPVAKAGGRIVATGIFPYPPGIPVLAPGERTGKQNGPILSYLKSMQDFDKQFPGFEHDTHGVENIKGEYMMYCIKEGRTVSDETDTTKKSVLTPPKVLGIFALAMINVAAVLSIRNFPSMAMFGWQCIGWYIIGTVLFLIPLSLAGAELATMLSDKGGGVYAWCKEAFGEKGGFVAIFCEWSNNLVWFPTVLAFIASTLAFALSPALGSNSMYLFVVMMIAFWGTTAIAYFGENVSSKFQNYGVILGSIIPSVLIIGLGVWWAVSGATIVLPPFSLGPDSTGAWIFPHCRFLRR